MTVKLANGLIIAEGEETELAIYTALTLDMLRRVAEMSDEDKAKKEAEILAKFMNMSFAEMMKKENEEEEHD